MDYHKLDRIKTPDEWIQDVLQQKEQLERTNPDKTKRRKQYTAICIAAACIVLLVLGIGIPMAAHADQIKSLLSKMFGTKAVKEVSWKEKTEIPDISFQKDGTLNLQENTMVVGEKECFVARYHQKGEKEVVDCVYKVIDHGLKKLSMKQFHGSCDGYSFIFSYVVQGTEIYGFNGDQGRDSVEVFPYGNGSKIYAAITYETKDDQTDKACIMELDLKTGTAQKISNDNMLCNFVMSPNGKKILCNHRADEYWSVFDVITRKESRISPKLLNGYARTSEIQFLDDDHILTLGRPHMKGNTEEYYSTYQIDLNKQKLEKEYKDNGTLTLQWSDKISKDQVEFYRIDTKEHFIISEKMDPYNHALDQKGEYLLYGDLEDADAPMYIVNLKKHSYQKIILPDSMKEDLTIHLVTGQRKLLLSTKKKAYLIDLHL